MIERGSEKALAGWATTRSGDDAPGTAVTGSWTSHSLQLAATTEMRTKPTLVIRHLADAAFVRSRRGVFFAVQRVSQEQPFKPALRH